MVNKIQQKINCCSEELEFDFWTKQFLFRLCLTYGQTPDYQSPFLQRIEGLTQKN